ncbi:MAG TPA: hypothetical protein PLF40_04840 [Kofleriaceae bacterium]|nr:hypothetical protein [Kofleriaceae bacterium]
MFSDDERASVPRFWASTWLCSLVFKTDGALRDPRLGEARFSCASATRIGAAFAPAGSSITPSGH